jgi:hypothetical protein
VTFHVIGLANKVTSVAVTFDLDHHDAGRDLDAALLGPGGSPQHILFARTGVVSGPTCVGYLGDVEGPYTLGRERGVPREVQLARRPS